MGVKRTPAQYNWRKLEFNEELLLPPGTHNKGRGGGRVQFFVAHHMIVLNRDKGSNDANRACYNIWTTGRQASAHYGVDGDFIDQFVYDNDTAWSNANQWANQNSIAIEHANATLDMPGTQNDYVIDERTFYNGAKLMAYLHLHYGLVPKKNVTIRRHSDFTATACPGPYFNRNWDRYCKLVTDIYNEIKKGKAPKQGALSSAPATPRRSQAQPARLKTDQVAREVIQGVWGNGHDRINRLRKAGYDPLAVQRVVNSLVGREANLKPLETIAREVVQGKWGNGQDRVNRLVRAGYNAQAVQREVNKLLR